MCAVLDEVLFDFAHAHDGVLEHALHEDAFLGVYHLIVGVFEFAVGLHVAEVEFAVVLEPFVVGSFVGDLDEGGGTPLSLRFSSRG